MVDELWGAGDGGGEHRHGSGVVHGNASLQDVLEAMKVLPDFTYTKPRADTNLLFVHRALDDGDLYFVDNRRDRDEDLEATFRVTGRQAELWHPDTGKREPASYRADGQRTAVSLHLAPWETVFVVFRRPSSGPSATRAASVQTELGAIDGPWTVAFQSGRGAPASAKFATLTSWAESSDPGIKYFSGTASYTSTVDAPAGWFKAGASQWIDLGDVKNLAEVTLNGKPLGIVWKRPFRLEATGILKPGANQIEVKVTNLWVNRMIGDRQPSCPDQIHVHIPSVLQGRLSAVAVRPARGRARAAARVTGIRRRLVTVKTTRICDEDTMTAPSVEAAYALAVERYAALGVDVPGALEHLRRVPFCCIAGRATTSAASRVRRRGSAADWRPPATIPGKARTPDELRSDAAKALALIPGTHRFNLHAFYGEFGGKVVDRDAIGPEHFAGWIDWAKSLGIGLDFNPTYFSHPKAADNITLSHRRRRHPPVLDRPRHRLPRGSARRWARRSARPASPTSGSPTA